MLIIINPIMKLIIFSLLLFAYVNSGAQVITFNRMYPDTVPSMINIVVSDTGYVILGAGGSSPWYILTAFIDTNGNLIYRKKITKSNVHVYPGMGNTLMKTGSNYLLAGSLSGQTNNNRSVYLLKFDYKFDTLWSKTYNFDTLFISGQACWQDLDGNIYITGQKGMNGTLSNGLLLKTDSSGTLIWYKTFGGSGIDYGSKIVPTYDGNLLIGGYTTSYFQTDGNWLLMKTDTAGTQLWLNPYLGNNDYDDGWVRSLINTSDSCYIATGNFAVENWDLRVSLVKLDKNLNVIYSKLYLNNSAYTSANSILELNNKNYLVTGIEILSGVTILGFLMELTPNGDIIWKRNFNATENVNSRSRAYAVAPTPDNGFAFTGHVYDTQITPAQQMWLVKTDSLGCDGVHSCDDTTMFVTSLNLPDSVCFGDSVHLTFGFGGRSAPYTLHSTTGFTEDSIYYFDSGNDTITRVISFLPQQANTTFSFIVTVTDPWGATKTGLYSMFVKNCSTSVAMQNSDLLAFQVYPNPVKDKIHISSTAQTEATVLLLNMQGSVVGETSLINQTATLNTQSLASGVYTVKIVYATGFVIKRVVKM
ncbi:MAG TPA: hypothetical protein DEH02_21150 [Bacteroidales bacterium]|nr:hypothetical protein [Bacteroidales bacterium]